MDGAGSGGGNGYSSAKQVVHVFRAERDAIPASISCIHQNLPVERLWANGAQLVALLVPCPPACILEADTVSNLVLVPSHVSPRGPNIFLCPIVRQVVDTDGRKAVLDVLDGRGRTRVAWERRLGNV